ncbi:putative Lipoprotein [metagenome]|uniref:Putative Lipoprotein n=1 Tax=metagenome TaxID=256318 RepID=A0A2P2C0U9_9ZZZZ
MNRTARRIIEGAAGIVLVSALAACGGGSDSDGDGGDDAASAKAADDFAKQSAEEIQKAAVADMKELDSMTMSGELTQGSGTLGLELSLNTDGECKGTITVGDGSAELINVGKNSYLKADEAFWVATGGSEEQGKAVVELLDGKWAIIPADGGFGQICDLDSLLSGFDAKNSESPTVGDVTEVDGQEAVEVSSTKDGGTVSALVATGEKHYILKIGQEGGSEPGSFTFSDFDADFEVEAPAKDETVDLSQAG